MTSMTAWALWPASCLTALVTSSLVSRRATSRSTGTGQDRIAARTRRRASAAAAGPVARRTRSPCRSAGRGGAVVVIGFLRAPVRPVRRPPAGWRAARCQVTQVLMQLALQDIGQLTDIGFPGVDVGFSAGVCHQLSRHSHGTASGGFSGHGSARAPGAWSKRGARLRSYSSGTAWHYQPGAGGRRTENSLPSDRVCHRPATADPDVRQHAGRLPRHGPTRHPGGGSRLAPRGGIAARRSGLSNSEHAALVRTRARCDARADSRTVRMTSPASDPAQPAAARIYDYLLGGKDNYAVDRAAAEKRGDRKP